MSSTCTTPRFKVVHRLAEAYQIVQLPIAPELYPGAVYAIMKPNGWIDPRRFETVADASNVVDHMIAKAKLEAKPVTDAWWMSELGIKGRFQAQREAEAQRHLEAAKRINDEEITALAAYDHYMKGWKA